MSTTQVSRQSWLARIKQSIGGAVVGFGLLVAMVMLLFWNEGRAVKTARGLDQGAGAVAAVSPQQVDPAMEGRLVHLSGETMAPAAIRDPDTGVTLAGLRLRRSVEMYQWVESTQTRQDVNLGGSQTTVTEYSYAPQWSAQPVDSSRFQSPSDHANPAMALRDASFNAEGVSLGSWSIDAPVLDQLVSSQAVVPSTHDLSALQTVLGNLPGVHVVDDALVIAQNPAAPAVGDYRIRYQLVPVQALSVVGRQTGHGLRPWQSEAGTSVLLVQTGLVPADAMFQSAHSSNNVMTWIWRAVGTFLVITAISWILGPLSIAASVLPLLGRALAMGTGLIAAGLGLALSALVIATAWFFYRPLLSLAIIAVAAALVAGVVVLLRRRQQQLSATAGQMPSVASSAG